MWSLAVTEYGAPLERVDREPPVPTGREVRLRILACGVCHSDLHYWQGGYELGDGERFTLEERGVRLPIVLGHEPVGVVEAVGPEAEGEVPVGAVRLVYPWLGCGACRRCAAGRDIDCRRMRTLGLFLPGGYSTHILVPDPRYLLDVTGIPETRAATLACAGVTAWGALRQAALRYPDDTLVMIGVGGVGLTAVGLAKALGVERVVAVDRDETKLEAALRAGADAAVLAGDSARDRKLLKLTGGGAGAAIDFVGAAETARLALDAIRRGGRVVMVGLYGGKLPVSLAWLPLRNISLVGTLTGTLDETREVIDFVREHPGAPAPVTERPLAEAKEALADLEAGRVTGRTVLVP
jgi:D-arabinose 1-dehydrogenase-like Zn-dependent alcohol dehydrogenase